MPRAAALRTIILSFCVLAFGATGLSAQGKRPAAEKITNGPVVEGTGASWAVIAWTTDTGGSTVVRYGTDRNHLSQTAQAPYADNEKMKSQNHRVKVTHLKPNTTYYFQADSGAGEGTGTEAKSEVKSFKTKAK